MTSQIAPSNERLSRISTGIVDLYREYFDRSSTATSRYAIDDVIVCVIRDGLAPIERKLLRSGRADAVRDLRAAMHEVVGGQLAAIVELQTGRAVVSSLSQAHADPDLGVEVFVLGTSLGEPGGSTGG